MKKIIIGLFVLLLVGCSGSISIESKPSEPAPQPRLIFGENYNHGVGPWINIIKDTENDIEYLVVRDGHGLAICPIIKKEVKAENE